MKIKSTLTIIAAFIFALSLVLSAQSKEKKNNPETRVTFIELGSVNCVPCKMMQPVMKNIENKYGSQVKVIFYDVWTAEDKPYSKKYGVRVIPTQVFLDKDGKEFHRHEGFYPEEEIDKILEKKGVKPLKGKS